MVITALDGRNIQIAIDALQAKLLVEILRRCHDVKLFSDAATAVQQAGFHEINSTHSFGAAISFESVIGYYTDTVNTLKEQQKDEAASKGVSLEDLEAIELPQGKPN